MITRRGVLDRMRVKINPPKQMRYAGLKQPGLLNRSMNAKPTTARKINGLNNSSSIRPLNLSSDEYRHLYRLDRISARILFDTLHTIV